MMAVFSREDLSENVNIDRLHFQDRSCKASWNSTHVIAKTPLTGCGTVFSKTEQTLFFNNVLSEEGHGGGTGVITRDYLFRANLTCAFPRKHTVGSFSFAPAKQRMLVNVGMYVTYNVSLPNGAESMHLSQPHKSQLNRLIMINFHFYYTRQRIFSCYNTKPN